MKLKRKLSQRVQELKLKNEYCSVIFVVSSHCISVLDKVPLLAAFDNSVEYTKQEISQGNWIKTMQYLKASLIKNLSCLHTATLQALLFVTSNCFLQLNL